MHTSYDIGTDVGRVGLHVGQGLYDIGTDVGSHRFTCRSVVDRHVNRCVGQKDRLPLLPHKAHIVRHRYRCGSHIGSYVGQALNDM